MPEHPTGQSGKPWKPEKEKDKDVPVVQLPSEARKPHVRAALLPVVIQVIGPITVTSRQSGVKVVRIA